MPENTNYQIVSFHFRVTFDSLPESKEIDMAFQSVSGLEVQIDKEALKEGGENRFEHNLPGRRKYSTLTLKRGVLTPELSALTKWCQDAFQQMKLEPVQTVNIQLLNENHEPLMTWNLAHVWPVSWKIGELNAEKGEVLIETLELSYNRFRIL